MTTAGTELIPSAFARLATLASFMSCTVISLDGHAIWLTRAIVSWHAPQRR